ncbi:hypothetical protein MSPP1_002325 [Malassezia sp. CBS 17886]|nr:hypothetical protein MSPP1_002325 [Malassezia sp. CBS 17886]
MVRTKGTRFCCCAIPLVKFGAYLLVLESAAVALAVGVIALAAPAVVGAIDAVPAWGKALMAAVAFVTLAWQVLGLIAVISDSPVIYRLYIRGNFLGTVAIICIALAYAATSAARHDTAMSACIARYMGPLADDGLGVQQVQDSLDTGRRTACKVVTWLDVGLMFALILVVGLTQLFMCYMQRRYGQRQRRAAADMKSGADDAIPLAHRDAAAWEPRSDPQFEPLIGHPQYLHDPVSGPHEPVAGPHAPYNTYSH